MAEGVGPCKGNVGWDDRDWTERNRQDAKAAKRPGGLL
jgi:hypothetical protein